MPCSCCVRVIKSQRAGMGKSLRVKRLRQKMKEWETPFATSYECIRLNQRKIDPSHVAGQLLKRMSHPSNKTPGIYHIDVAHEVGIAYFVISLEFIEMQNQILQA